MRQDDKKLGKIIRWLVLVVVLLVAFFGVGWSEELEITEYRIASEKWLGSQDLTIVVVTDLHSTMHGENQSLLIDYIKQQTPDFIFLVGDIIDDIIPEEGAHLFFQGIQALAPAYYVTGNHEYRSREIDRLRAMVTSYGITILSDNYEMVSVHGEELVIAGMEDPAKRRYERPLYDYEGSMERAFSDLREDDMFKILLAHRPEWIETYLGYPFDLVVSGHAHGGQVRIPLLAPNGLYAPNQGLFPSYTGGRYEHGSVVHIVSRGVAVYKERPRIYNRPELVVIKIDNNTRS